MLQLKPETPDLWDSILPEELRKLPEELARVDILLQDERLMEPFLRNFNQTQGRPGVPISTYLRLMYLKFRYKLGYETLVAEVSDSIAWRRFCGIGYLQRIVVRINRFLRNRLDVIVSNFPAQAPSGAWETL
jgi:IS5 family transposase